MTALNDFHSEAMNLAEEAFRLLRGGEDDRARLLFRQALSSEIEAASLLPLSEESEPSRSILYRSAASLAFNAGDYEAAERLVAHGLSGFPPPEVREELRTLYDDIKVKVKTHLQTQGVVTQAQINYGQRQVNYCLTEIDLKVIEVLKTLVETLKTLTTHQSEPVRIKDLDFSSIEAAVEKAHEISERVADIRPPGCEDPANPVIQGPA